MISFFDHAHSGSHAEIARRIGGKGASLWAMTSQLGLPVPPGFTIEASQCAAGVTAEVMDQVMAALAQIGRQLGRRFGDPAAPLLVSVRSGAPVSMPGMMDTILNVGLTPATRAGLADITGDPAFAEEAYATFQHHYTKAVPGDAPWDDAQALLAGAIQAVFASWNSPRAKVYRAHEGIADDLGTAVTIQAMVFGNLDARSGTGVLFSRDPSPGAPVLTGDWLPKAQGEAVVAGDHATLPLSAFEAAHPQAAAQLRQAAAVLEAYYRDMVDIEFTLEAGKLWILQARPGKRSPAAAARLAVDLAADPAIALSHAEALARVPADVLSGAVQTLHADAGAPILAKGLGVSPGLASGKLVLDPDAAVEAAEEGEDIILVRRETSPEDVHGMAVAKGIITTLGGLMSHAAVVARAWGLPAVCGADAIHWSADAIQVGGLTLRAGDLISLDGATGDIFAGVVRGHAAAADPYLEILRDWQKQAGETGYGSAQG
jgi:pyruvate, orthophosphate dikinase